MSFGSWVTSIEDVQRALDDLAEQVQAQSDQYLPGDLKMTSGTNIPTGWEPCEGQLLQKGAYPELFAAISDLWTYDGPFSTTFRVPDLRGRFLVGTGFSAGIGSYTMGQYGGAYDAVPIAHSHSGVTVADGDHAHILADTTSFAGITLSGGGTSEPLLHVPGAVALATANAGTHSHSFTTTLEGFGGTGRNVPPYASVTILIKA